MNTKKILINCDYGCFALSDEACELYLNKKKLSFSKKIKEGIFGSSALFKINSKNWSCDEIRRDDPVLIETVEQLGLEKSSGIFSSLKIIEIPNDIEWEIVDHDGMEEIHEKHRKWN